MASAWEILSWLDTCSGDTETESYAIMLDRLPSTLMGIVGQT
jgi:hypothetical protein